MKEQTSSIAHLASKFTDKDEAESDGDSSSFEDVPKPVDRSERNAPQAKEPFEPTAIPRGLVPQPIEPEPRQTIPASSKVSSSSQPAHIQPEVLPPPLYFSPFFSSEIDSLC